MFVYINIQYETNNIIETLEFLLFRELGSVCLYLWNEKTQIRSQHKFEPQQY